MSLLNHEHHSEPKEAIETNRPEDQAKNMTGGMNLIAEMFTLAWNLVIPIVGGVMLGHYLDNRNSSGSGITWTLSLLVLGVLIAFSNLYNLYIEQGQKKLEVKPNKNEDERDHAQEE